MLFKTRIKSLHLFDPTWFCVQCLLNVRFNFLLSVYSETSSVSNSSDGGLYTNDEGRQGAYPDMSISTGSSDVTIFQINISIKFLGYSIRNRFLTKYESLVLLLNYLNVNYLRCFILILLLQGGKD